MGENKCSPYTNVVNHDDFLHELRTGEESLDGIEFNDINFLSFLCDHAFSNELSPFSKRCIDAMNVFQGPIAKFLLEESSLFETYFSSFSQSSQYRRWALSNVLSHLLVSFPDDVLQLLNNSDVILPTLLHHLKQSLVQDFFYQLYDSNPLISTKLFSTILRVLCGKSVTDENIANIVKKSFIDQQSGTLIPLCLNFIHPEHVNVELSSILELLINDHPLKILKLAKNIARNDTISKYCINTCCDDSTFTQVKVEALTYLSTFPSINCTKIVKNVRNHFFSETTNSMLHCAVVKFVRSALKISELKKAIIINFEQEIQKICNNDTKANPTLVGHCFAISQELDKYLSSEQWLNFVSSRLDYWNNKTSKTKSKKVASTFSFDETDYCDNTFHNVNDMSPPSFSKFDFTSGININDFVSMDDDLNFQLNPNL